MTTIDAEMLARRIPLQGTYNVRDIGGYVTTDGRLVARHLVLRGDALHQVDDEGRELLAAMTLRTTIDLREKDESDVAPDRVNARAELVSIPLFTYREAADSDVTDRGQFASLDEVYRFIVSKRGTAVAAVLRELAQPDSLPAIVHCTAGKDRTGIVIALLLSLLGVPDETIARDYHATDHFLAGEFYQVILRRAEENGHDPVAYTAMLGCEPHLILEVLAQVRTSHGDVATYLMENGLETRKSKTFAPRFSRDNPANRRRRSRPAATSREPLVEETKIVIQLSDLHITGEGDLFGKVDTLHSLKTILDRIEKAGACDALVLSGDLTDKGEPEAYQRLREVVDAFSRRAEVPVLYLPGNHDDRSTFRSHILDLEGDDDKSDQVLLVDGLRIIGLDSTADEGHHGELSDEQLDWLQRELSEAAPLGTIVVLHHPPIPGPIEVINLLGLRDPHRLGDVVADSDVKMILAGHTHHASAGQLAGVPVWVATATAYQCDVAASDDGVFRGVAGSGYARIDVDSMGAYATHLPVAHSGELLYEVDLGVMQRHITGGHHEGELETTMSKP